MKNKDRYKDQIYDEVLKYCEIGIDKNTKEPHLCNFMNCEDCLFCDRHSCLGSIKTWLESEEELDDVEKKYLRNFLKPFKKHDISIEKHRVGQYEYLSFTFCKNDKYNEIIDLPAFKKGKMYIGMRVGTSYTPEELGLW